MLVKENLPIIIDRHPSFKSLNQKILKEGEFFQYSEGLRNHDGGLSNIRSPKTIGRRVTSPSLELVYQWILSFLSYKKNHKFYIDQSWLAHYKVGGYGVSHDHNPSAWSFVYFVRCPRGSSPLVFTTSGKKIKAEEGKLLIFPGFLAHHVPKNKCDGRIVLAGNIYFTLDS
tara:strand:- start:16 stop:528 length:513 start_codon:yes stop_codon:yes gene_type:complete